MDTGDSTIARGFSLIELVLVVTIIGIIAAIALPKFAHAGSGRRLMAAKSTLLSDIEMIRLRARASSKVHVLKFYPNENRYIIVEGTAINRESVILSRDFDDEPYTVGISRTNLGADQAVAFSVYGDVSPGFMVGLTDGEVEIAVVVGGVASLGAAITDEITLDEVKALDVGVGGVGL